VFLPEDDHVLKEMFLFEPEVLVTILTGDFVVQVSMVIATGVCELSNQINQ